MQRKPESIGDGTDGMNGTDAMVDLKSAPPPPEWGVQVDAAAIGTLADRWCSDAFVLPAFDYPGTPPARDEHWWFDYVTVAVSVLACLWPPEGETMWHVEHDGEWLDDAPGIFAVITRRLTDAGLDLTALASLTESEGADLFGGRGTLQQIPERTDLLRRVAAAIIERWGGSALQLVNEADRHAPTVVTALIDTVPGYYDRPTSDVGVLPFDKLAHLATAIMAAGTGWNDGGFTGFDDFPVYPDYMLPRVLRHYGCLVYAPEVAAAVDARQIIAADSPAEHALRWATVYAGAKLKDALASKGALVTAPALDYRLWSEAVLGPDASAFGEHHRTLTMAY